MKKFGLLLRNCLLLLSLCCAGCATTEQNVGLGLFLGTSYLARTPSNEIEQIYYLGTFDPQEQIPPTIYRVRVHGQASAMNSAKFASGWVKAGLVDSLGTKIGFDKAQNGNLTFANGAMQSDPLINIASERRMMIFGPEGFREAPKDHRMVLVMGSSPEAYFQAVDQALGEVVSGNEEEKNVKAKQQMALTLVQLANESERLKSLAQDVANDFSEGVK